MVSNSPQYHGTMPANSRILMSSFYPERYPALSQASGGVGDEADLVADDSCSDSDSGSDSNEGLPDEGEERVSDEEGPVGPEAARTTPGPQLGLSFTQLAARWRERETEGGEGNQADPESEGEETGSEGEEEDSNTLAGGEDDLEDGQDGQGQTSRRSKRSDCASRDGEAHRTAWMRPLPRRWIVRQNGVLISAGWRDR